MPRSLAPGLPLLREPSAPRQKAAAERPAGPLDSSPRMLAQRRQIESLFDPGTPTPNGVLQGYFMVNGQKTNDPEQFTEEVAQDEERKKAQVWFTLRPALEAEWKKLEDHQFSAEILDEFRDKLLGLALDDKKYNLQAAAANLDGVARRRAEIAREQAQAKVPLAATASPAGVGGTLSTNPTLGEKEKHSNAVYKRTTTDPETAKDTVTDESFDSDAYTKGPSRRDRNSEPATTPKGDKQAWTVKQVKDSIQRWTCEFPLARHLALTIWPLLTNSEAGRRWEVKFREIDRLITFRDAEGQSRFIEILQKSTGTKVKSLDRQKYSQRAREALKAALLGGTKHPAEQQGVLFYDTLLKAAVNADWQNADSATFALTAAYSVVGEGGLSMILTHWRPILYFDWILAEDVLNNATDA